MSQKENSEVTAYSIYNVEQKKRTKINPLEDIYPKLPEKKYQVIYADPPWDYGGKMQYDKSTIKDENVGFENKIFLFTIFFYAIFGYKLLLFIAFVIITKIECVRVLEKI